MAELYIDGVEGNDANDGTAASPKQSVGTSVVDDFFSSNDTGSTVYVANTVRAGGDPLIITTPTTNCAIRQWPGRPKAVIRGDTPITGTWDDSAAPEYSIDIGAGLGALVYVVEDWDTNLDSQGRHLGYMNAVPTSTLAANDTFYDNVTGILTIRCADDGNPNERSYSYSLLEDAGRITEPSGLTVEGVDFYLWGTFDDNAADPNGCGVHFVDGTGCRVKGCDFIGCLAGGVSASCTDSATTSDLIVSGCYFETAVQNRALAVLGDDTGNSTYSGVVFEGCTFFANGTLDRAGEKTSGMADISSQKVCKAIRAAGTGITFADIEIRNCHFDGYEDGDAMQLGTAAGAASDPADWTTYPFRIVNCTGVRLRHGIFTGTASAIDVAVRFCNFDVPSINVGGTPSSATSNFAFGFSGDFLVESSSLSADTGDSTTFCCMGATATGNLILRNSAIYDVSTTPSSSKALIRCATTASAIDSADSVWLLKAASRLVDVTTGSFTDSMVTLSGNAYHGYDPDDMSDSASFSDEDEWATLDATGIFATELEQIAGDLDSFWDPDTQPDPYGWVARCRLLRYRRRRWRKVDR